MDGCFHTSARQRSAAVMLAGAMAAGLPMAQDKPASAGPDPASVPTKTLFDNDRVRVQEVTFRPGDQGPNVPRPFRVIRVLEGGTMQRTFPDGKVDNVVYKTGEVVVFEADNAFVPKNIGSKDIVLYVVAVKAPRP